MSRYLQDFAKEEEADLGRIGNPDSEVYRFVWEPSFHHPVSFTLQHTDGEKTLTVKTMGWSDPCDPDFFFIDGTKGVSVEEWETFLRLLEKADYWIQPSTEAPSVTGLDGACWVLEARKSDRYHIVERWSPNERSAEALRFREACVYLVEMSGQVTQHVY